MFRKGFVFLRINEMSQRDLAGLDLALFRMVKRPAGRVRGRLTEMDLMDEVVTRSDSFVE